MRELFYIIREVTGFSVATVLLYAVVAALFVWVAVQVVGHVHSVERMQSGLPLYSHGGR